MASARTRPLARVVFVVVAGLLASGVVGLSLWYWASARGERNPFAPGRAVPMAEVPIDATSEAEIRAFCGDCHALPRPESFHRDAWHEEVEKAYEFFARSGRTDLAPPPMYRVTAYFRARAPAEMTYPPTRMADTKFRASFEVEKFDQEASAPPASGIAFLGWYCLRTGQRPVLVASDMVSGSVSALDLRSQDRALRRIAQLNNPCHIEPCDLDQDGHLDLLVGDLGSYRAMDHDRGRVVWLRAQPGARPYEEVVVGSGLGRVADVRAADFDADGDLDLVVAEFGWLRTGAVRFYRNVAPRGQRPQFQPEILDLRTGTIHVPVCDLNRDGRPDFIALISNESECVEAFLNQPEGTFHRQTLWRAPDLTFGSSGIQLVDLDADGDVDVLYANGDAFDNRYLSPWHGVQWLENLGDGRFECHRLVDLPGATMAVPGDLDQDGDLDILVSAFLPMGLKPDTAALMHSRSVAVLEQVSRGQFVCHALETDLPCHPAAALGDFDGDGDLDFALGNQGGRMGRTWLMVWWNRQERDARGPIEKTPAKR